LDASTKKTTLGTNESLDLLVRVAESCGELLLRYNSVRLPIEQAFASTFHKAPKSLETLEQTLEKCSDELIEIIATALSSAPSLEAVKLLETLLGKSEGLDNLVVGELAAMVVERPWHLDGAVREIIRPLLASKTSATRVAAIVALARIRDLESFSVFALLVEDDDPKLGQVADWALRELAGSPRGTNTRERLDWYDHELDWWESNQALWQFDLESANPPTLMAAVRSLTARPIFRNEAALHLSVLLEYPSPDMVVATCSALGQLGSRQVVPALASALSNSNSSIQKAAVAALARIIHEPRGKTPRIGSCWHFADTCPRRRPCKVVEDASICKVPAGTNRPAVPVVRGVWSACS
jgi:HEAT repeat protein